MLPRYPLPQRSCEVEGPIGEAWHLRRPISTLWRQCYTGCWQFWELKVVQHGINRLVIMWWRLRLYLYLKACWKEKDLFRISFHPKKGHQKGVLKKKGHQKCVLKKNLMKYPTYMYACSYSSSSLYGGQATACFLISSFQLFLCAFPLLEANITPIINNQKGRWKRTGGGGQIPFEHPVFSVTRFCLFLFYFHENESIQTVR